GLRSALLPGARLPGAVVRNVDRPQVASGPPRNCHPHAESIPGGVAELRQQANLAAPFRRAEADPRSPRAGLHRLKARSRLTARTVITAAAGIHARRALPLALDSRDRGSDGV